MEKWPPALITTTNGLFYLDENGKIRHIVDGVFYGITWTKDKIYFAENPPEHVLSDDKGAKDGDRIRVMERNFQVKTKFHQLPRDVWSIHQIFARDNVMSIVCTKNDTIVDWDIAEEKEITRHHCYEPTKNFNQDCKRFGAHPHINSIFFKDDKVWICEHWHGKSWIRARNIETWEEVEAYTGGLMCHNVFATDDRIITLSSGTAHVLVHNRKTEAQKEFNIRQNNLSKYASWVRGLSKVGDRYLIGLSNRCRDRKSRGHQHCWVLLLDEEFKTIQKVKLPGRSGPITDLRAIEGDLAHNGLNAPI